SDGLGEFTGRGAATHRLRSCFQANWLERYLIECAFKSSRVTNSRTEVCVASRSIGAARLCSSADFQRVTQTHHLSPGLSQANSGSSVETVASPSVCLSACSTARHGSMAHFTRWGNLRTPRIARRSPSFFGASLFSLVTKS